MIYCFMFELVVFYCIIVVVVNIDNFGIGCEMKDVLDSVCSCYSSIIVVDVRVCIVGYL